MKELTDYAFLVSKAKDTETWQHAKTNQLFRLVDIFTTGYALYIFNSGKWEYQGDKSLGQIIHIAASVN